MIEYNYDSSLLKLKSLLNIQSVNSNDTGDLILASTSAVKNNVDILYLRPESIPLVWGWVEKTPLKLYACIDFDIKKPERQIGNIKKYLNSGANGIQINTTINELEYISELISPLKNELFFNRELSIGLKLNTIHSDLVPNLIHLLNIIKTNKLSLIVDESDDVVSWAFGLFKLLPNNVNFNLEIFIDSYSLEQIEKIYRLGESMIDDFKSKVHFAVPFDFFNYYPDED